MPVLDLEKLEKVEGKVVDSRTKKENAKDGKRVEKMWKMKRRRGEDHLPQRQKKARSQKIPVLLLLPRPPLLLLRPLQIILPLSMSGLS